MLGIRFFIAGYLDGRGYAVKDLEDNTVEWLDFDTVINYANQVKIYGVDSGQIYLDWFYTFYSKCVITLGLTETRKKLGVILSEGDVLVPFIESDKCIINLDFIEFITELNYVVSDGILNIWFNTIPAHTYEHYIVDSNSMFLHISKKYSNLGVFSVCYLDKLNLYNILEDNATVSFKSDVDDNATVVVDGLLMHRCTYNISFSGSLYLISTLEDTDICINLTPSASYRIFVGKDFNLNNLTFRGTGRLHSLHIQDGVDRHGFYLKLCQNIYDSGIDGFARRILQWNGEIS